MTHDASPIVLRPTAALAFTKELYRLGRNHGPALMFDWWWSKRLTLDELRVVITEVWMMAEWPMASLGQTEWVWFFRTTGFVTDDEEDRPQPTEPLTVYRGSTWGRRRGMSWTENRDRAQWFADRWDKPAFVFEVTVEPSAVLARIGTPEGRDESEVVVDPAMLPPVRRPT